MNCVMCGIYSDSILGHLVLCGMRMKRERDALLAEHEAAKNLTREFRPPEDWFERMERPFWDAHDRAQEVIDAS